MQRSDEARKPGRFRFRVLPIMLLAACLMLTVRVGDVWDGMTAFMQSVRVAQNEALAQANSTMSPGAQVATADLPRDPTRFSQSEIDLLQALSARRDALDKREREIAQREVILQAAEKRLEEKVAELETVKNELMRLVGRRNEEEDSRLKSLVRIYESMKPKDAAAILEKLDTDVLIGVVERMKEAKVAPILASMQTDRAKAVTALLADRKGVTARP
jgi:flagellar motility protein MotE (MotC chaperone)